jgi:predicted nucleic acid-binding protein
MSDDRLFIDTVFVQALLDRNDQWHVAAKALRPLLDRAREVFMTEAILVEIGNALSTRDRAGAVDFIQGCYESPKIRVIGIDTGRLLKALALYRDRTDKRWGLTDCISFVVMDEFGLTAALTADEHFVQAGFRALMREGV